MSGFRLGLALIHRSSLQINIVTSFRYTQSWPKVIRLANEGIFGDVTKLITHVLPIEKAVEAMETTADRSKLAIKVQIVD